MSRHQPSQTLSHEGKATGSQPFRHMPLAGPHRTRLLWLQPERSTSSPLRCQIGEIVLAAGHVPPYEALSYAWELHEGSSTILCSHRTPVPTYSTDGGLPLLITRNCEAALRQLRFVDRQRVLWVDAICIDQTSGEDKEAQVPL